MECCDDPFWRFFFSLASLINRHDSRPVGSPNEPVRLITGHKFQLAVQVLGQLAGKLHTGKNGQLAKSLTKARLGEGAGNKHMRIVELEEALHKLEAAYE